MGVSQFQLHIHEKFMKTGVLLKVINKPILIDYHLLL